MSVKTLMTVEEFVAMSPEDTEDYELVEGELIPISSGNPLHVDVLGFLEFLLRTYFSGNPSVGHVLSEMDCQLTLDTIRRPDAAIFIGGRVKQIDRRKSPVAFAPDIAVEVLSPSEKATDVRRKTLEYLAAGSQEVWQFDLENGEILVQTNSGIRVLRGEDRLESPLLPGFSFPASVLLAGF